MTPSSRQKGTYWPRAALRALRGAGAALSVAIWLAAPAPAAAQAAGGEASRAPDLADGRLFEATGFAIDHDPFWDYFVARGGREAFGYPVSRTLTLLGCTAQIFQRHVLQQCGGGPVQPLNLLDPQIMPATRVNGSALPAHDPDVARAAPLPDAAGYGQAVLAHLAATVPDTFAGLPVGFFRAYMSTAPAGSAPNDSVPAALSNLELWGFPTSRPAQDPSNAGFVYQRFQRGVLHYDRATGATAGLLLGDALKAVLTGAQLPADLEAEMHGSRLLRQYCPANARAVCRPDALPATDLSGAFEPAVGGSPGGPPASPTPPAAPVPPAPPAGEPRVDGAAAAAVEASRRAAAARPGGDPAAVRLVRVEARAWSDASLGCPQPGAFYAQVITPGFLVVLDAGGTALEYHTDTHGRAVLCAPGG